MALLILVGLLKNAKLQLDIMSVWYVMFIIMIIHLFISRTNTETQHDDDVRINSFLITFFNSINYEFWTMMMALGFSTAIRYTRKIS